MNESIKKKYGDWDDHFNTSKNIRNIANKMHKTKHENCIINQSKHFTCIVSVGLKLAAIHLAVGVYR